MDGQPVGLVEAAQVLDLPPAALAGRELAVVVVSDRSHRFVVPNRLGQYSRYSTRSFLADCLMSSSFIYKIFARNCAISQAGEIVFIIVHKHIYHR